MVVRGFSQILSIIITAVYLSGCGLVHSIWGEKAPPRKTALVQSEKLPDITDIFSDDDHIGKNTFNQYQKLILDTFDKIEGQNKNFLTLQEIDSLSRAGLANLSDNEEISIKRIHSTLTLLGFKDGISRDQVVSLLDWLDKNRVNGKAFYDTLIHSTDGKMLDSKSLIQLVQFAGSFISLGGGASLSNEQLIELIQPWIPEKFTHATQALPSGIELVNAAFSSLCGDRVESNLWNAKKNGNCLLLFIDHFQGVSPIFDLVFNHLNPLTERGALATANSTLVDKVQSWIKDHEHPPFLTQKIATFAEQLEIPMPYRFFQLTAWIPKLNSESTEKSLSPTIFIDLSHMVQNWINTFIEVTTNTKEKDGCSFNDWKNCKFQGEYDTAKKLYNDEYATLIRNNNLDFIYKISLYDSVSDYLIKSLNGDQDGVMINDIKDLISVTVHLMDSNAFVHNVFNRIQEKPIEEVNFEKSIEALRRQGLGEVAALAADLIPDRGGNKRSIFKKLTATVYDSQKFPTYKLDRLGITTFIYVFDLLGNLRNQYLHDYDFEPVVEGANTWIKRRKIVELIPRILYDHFPRIYNECLDWGFERTCGVIYTEVLASAAKDKDVLEPSDMDMITLTSILLESMMNRCDRNHDDKLSTNILDGFDEKSCALTVSTTLASRLMHANLLENDHTTKILLRVERLLPPVKWIAKVALERGTLKGIGWRAIPPVSIFSKPAKLGGLMSLTAELMDPEKVDAIEAGIMGHHEDAGDELIYLNQLTDRYLPSRQWAIRTSAAARILYGPSVVHH